VVTYHIVFTKKAMADIPKLKAARPDTKAKALIEILRETPYATTPRYEKLKGALDGAYSRRINLQHRMVYQVVESEKTIKILSMWSHYEL
jgi:Txe/YoeB family toxin of toxin-antitoxin system